MKNEEYVAKVNELIGEIEAQVVALCEDYALTDSESMLWFEETALFVSERFSKEHRLCQRDKDDAGWLLKDAPFFRKEEAILGSKDYVMHIFEEIASKDKGRALAIETGETALRLISHLASGTR